jgi:endoglycosylceramidase
MGYDLINEPWVGLEWATCAIDGCPGSYKELQRAQDKALAGIRTVDPSSIVWYEPQQLSAGLLMPTWLRGVLGEQNLGLSWHNYCSATFLASFGIPFDATETCKSFTRNRERNAIDQAARMDAVPMMSEWGATDNARALEIDADAADENRMSWLYWAYKRWDDPTTADTAQGLFTNDADLTSVKADKLRQLVRTYPQATAGRDLSYHYDPDTGAFTMTYRGDADIAAPTRIFVSPITAPHGYDVVSSAGTVTEHGSYVDVDARTDDVVTISITPRP